MATLGVAIGGPYATLGALAAEVERHGFDTAWVAETSHDAMIQAAVAIQATSTVTVGTNIALAFPRSPTVTAMQAWDLDEISGSRFVVGLGSQVKRIIEERFSADFDRPALRMAEYVQAMHAAWAMERGEDVRFEGEIYRVLRPGLTGLGRSHERQPPPVLVAAVGPLMTRAAATYADGLLGHPFTSERYLTTSVLPRIDQALADASRSRDDFKVCQGVIVAISDDGVTARQEAKQQVGFYGTTPNYRAVFAAHGDDELNLTLRRVWRRTSGDPDALAAEISDDVLDRYAVAGTPDEVADRLEAIARHVDHVILGGAWYRVPMQRMAENLWAIMTTFGSVATPEGP
ncbi:MAG: TIGR03617 family F420-dependent LLM class oxidoreductase [Nitriliruptoraceae bacterium]